ncbi:MAG: glycosyltransferase [Candidatus Schekmanbacteria bacterium]|nr:MAG: glycosyltransferase [Candidatus Schekmanbacteria bacterium]
MNSEEIELSIVIPVYNEADNIAPLIKKIEAAIEKIRKKCEVIFVDDGSTDGSSEILQKECLSRNNFTLIQFRKNFGQTAAISAGFDYSKGNVIITLDSDLQNDPADIPLLLEKIDEGYDVVSGWRKNRKDNPLTRNLPSAIANWIIGIATGVKLHDYGCTLKAYKKEIIQDVSLYGDLHRFIPALAAFEGAKITEIPVNHHPRQFGKSKYNLSRTWRVLFDLLTVSFLRRYKTRPLHIFGRVGLISFLLGFLISAYLTLQKFLYGIELAKRPLLILGVLLILAGIQLLSLGILAEMQTRTYFESQKQPIYRIKKIVNSNLNERAD